MPSVESTEQLVNGQAPVAPGISTPDAEPRVHQLYRLSTTWTYVLGDFIVAQLCIVAALVVLAAASTTARNSLLNLTTNYLRSVWFPPSLVLAMVTSGTYRRSWRSPNQPTFLDLKDQVVAIGGAALISLGLNSLSGFGLRQLGLPHLPNNSATQMVAITLTAVVAIPAWRSLLRRSILNDHPIRVVVADSGLRRERITTHLMLTPGFEVVGWVVGEGVAPPPEALGSMDAIRELCISHEIDLVVVGSFKTRTERTTNLLRTLNGVAKVSLVPRSFELVSWRSRFTEMSGLPLIEVAPPHISRWDRLTKRSFDLALATTLLVLASPIMLLAAVVVKLSSRGPVLFAQERLGRGRDTITVRKFRTMTVEPARALGDEELPSHHRASSLAATRNKAAEASRITRPGAFLRRSGIDELPQLFNVLGGSMSMVGPRPFVPEEETGDPLEAKRYEVRPGITGLWQISGRNELSDAELRHLDYLYVTTWSFWWDLRIALETPRVMLRGIGAY